jgi:hypothetical protein
MDTGEQYRRFLRQLFLTRYDDLLKRIRAKLPYTINDETHTTILNALVTVRWIDETLDEVKALPIA